MNHPKGKRNPTGNRQKLVEEMLLDDGYPPIACQPCDPSAGLAIGGKPITIEALNRLTPDDLEEHAVTRNGVELTAEEFAQLLELPPEFAQMLNEMEMEKDDAILEIPPGCAAIAATHDGALAQPQERDKEGGGAFLPPNADEFLFLALADPFRGPSKSS